MVGSGKTCRRNEIITELYKRKDIDKICEKVGKNWADQLKSELFLVLCEMDPDKLIEKHEGGYLTFWIFRTVINMGYPSSNFSRNIKGMEKGIVIEDLEKAENIADDIADPYSIENERLDNLPETINKLDFFHRDIINNYLKNGNNISKTAKMMDINRKYVGNLVKESKQMIEAIMTEGKTTSK